MKIAGTTPTKNTARQPKRGSTSAVTIAASAVADRPAALHQAERLAAMLLPATSRETSAAPLAHSPPMPSPSSTRNDRELRHVLREAARGVKTE